MGKVLHRLKASVALRAQNTQIREQQEQGYTATASQKPKVAARQAGIESSPQAAWPHGTQTRGAEQV